MWVTEEARVGELHWRKFGVEDLFLLVIEKGIEAISTGPTAYPSTLQIEE